MRAIVLTPCRGLYIGIKIWEYCIDSKGPARSLDNGSCSNYHSSYASLIVNS